MAMDDVRSNLAAAGFIVFLVGAIVVCGVMLFRSATSRVDLEGYRLGGTEEKAKMQQAEASKEPTVYSPGERGTEDLETLIATLGDKSHDAQTRARAAEKLGLLGDRRAVPVLCRVIEEREVGVIRFRSRVDSSSMSPVGLETSTVQVRVNAIRALGRIGDASAVPVIASRLEIPLGVDQDGNPAYFATPFSMEDKTVRVEAAKALAQIGDMCWRAAWWLVVAAKNMEPEVREQCIETLKIITKQDFGSDPEKWEDWIVEHVKDLRNIEE